MASTNGTIKRLVHDKGFGFIAASDGSEYFFHQSSCQTPFDELREGQAVTFEKGQGPKGPRGENVKLAELAAETGVSVFHLQRTFKRVMGISPKHYLAARRFGNFKALIRKGESVTNSLYESGFNSSSRLYEHAADELGMTPATYSRGGRGVKINYPVVASPMGRLLVAVTERGVCAVRLGADHSRRRYPA